MRTFNAALLSALTITGTPLEEVTDGGDPDKTFELFNLVKDGKATVEKNDDGVLTASLSKRAVRAIRRAEKAERQAELKEEIVACLEAERPQKIGPVVATLAGKRGLTDKDEIQKFRGEVLEAFRALRGGDDPTVLAQNDTGSNFHVRYTLAASPDPFPVPEPETDEADDSDSESTESNSDNANA